MPRARGFVAASALLDHCGLLAMPQQAIGLQRRLGIGLVLAGAFVLRRAGSGPSRGSSAFRFARARPTLGSSCYLARKTVELVGPRPSGTGIVVAS